MKMKDGLRNNPNDLINNLTGRILSDIGVEILKYGLKHRILTRPSEAEITVIVENIWDQIEHNDLCENLMKKERVKLHYVLSLILMLTSLICSFSMIKTKQKF